jgi:hypothetical protein
MYQVLFKEPGNIMNKTKELLNGVYILMAEADTKQTSEMPDSDGYCGKK